MKKLFNVFVAVVFVSMFFYLIVGFGLNQSDVTKWTVSQRAIISVAAVASAILGLVWQETKED